MKSQSELYNIIKDVINVPGNHVVIANKMIIQYISSVPRREFNLEVGIHGDLERGVVDYVIARKSDGEILLVSPHSRISMGVDPPVENPKIIVVLYGLRRPVREYIKLDRLLYDRLFYFDPDLGVMDYRVYRDDRGLYYVYVADSRYSYLFIYDIFDYKYDKHMLLQIIGRWYMQNVELIVYNSKYGLMDIKYYAIDVWVFGIPHYPFYVEVGIKRLGESGMTWKVFDGAKSFDEAVAKVLSYEKRDSAGRLKRLDYLNLRNVYNSLRYVKKQLKYRTLSKEEEWWLAGKVARMINGFDYAHEKGLTVPDGLKRFYKIYRGEGIRGCLRS